VRRKVLVDPAIVDPALLAALTGAVGRAASLVLALSRDVPAPRNKADGSPVSDADERAEAALLQAMAELMPGVPVISEEMHSRPAQPGTLFILIDPLDGTKEYLARLPEYTVNLAVVHNAIPQIGIVAVPAAGAIYRGISGAGAVRLAMAADGLVIENSAEPIHVREASGKALIAAVSRSHLDTATLALLDRLGVATRLPCGSALKFCRVAEGAVDLYPRLAPTCEWDVAAGHALVVAAGGVVTSPNGEAVTYGNIEGDCRIPGFVASGDRAGIMRFG
jgi:3'(2'), 5'-bisphosphate nucleotidase